MPSLTEAIDFLKTKHGTVFSNEFLAKPDVSSWILQAIIDASNPGALSYDEYAELKKLGDFIHKKGPNENLPERAQIVQAIKFVYINYRAS